MGVIIHRLIIIFMIYSVFGWIFESAYCTLKDNRWENRGFLFGPSVPIYGVGSILISLISQFSPRVLSIPEIFVISFFGSIVLEYITSLCLEKIFHASWWDYSNLPFNIKGRVSLFTSLGFGCGGILVIRVLHPAVEDLVNQIPVGWQDLLSMILLVLFTVDLTLTINALISLQNIVMNFEDNFNRRMELFVDSSHERADLFRASLSEKIPKFSFTERSVLRRIKGFHYSDLLPGKKKQT